MRWVVLEDRKGAVRDKAQTLLYCLLVRGVFDLA